VKNLLACLLGAGVETHLLTAERLGGRSDSEKVREGPTWREEEGWKEV